MRLSYLYLCLIFQVGTAFSMGRYPFCPHVRELILKVNETGRDPLFKNYVVPTDSVTFLLVRNISCFKSVDRDIQALNGELDAFEKKIIKPSFCLTSENKKDHHDVCYRWWSKLQFQRLILDELQKSIFKEDQCSCKGLCENGSPMDVNAYGIYYFQDGEKNIPDLEIDSEQPSEFHD